MKTLQNTIKKIAFLVILMQCALAFGQFTPIVPNTTPQTDNCSVTGGVFNISVPTEALSGANIPLNITLPGTLDVSCNVGVTIDFSSNLNFVTSPSVAFSQTGNTLTSTTALAGNDGQNFNVYFKFPPYITCNGEVGTFTVTTTGCNGDVCTTTVNISARAEDYWTVSKQYVSGNLVCGNSYWRHRVLQNNPNPYGQGTYSISGAITETTSLPIISGASHTFSGSGAYNSALYGTTILQNCSDDGTIITNTANYSYTLGNGCETKTGSVNIDSPPLSAPNANISFTKSVYANSGYVSNGGTLDITAGCNGRYALNVYNNGNVPWTNLVITDNLNIPGLTIDSITANSSVWTSSPPMVPALSSMYTFTSVPGFVLNPGSSATVHIYFTVDVSNSVGTIINNSASLSYQASTGSSNSNGNGNLSNVCPGINCPQLDTTVQNSTASVNINVSTPVSIPRIVKCIDNAPPSNIYQLGDTISFRILVENRGSGDLSTTVSDNLQLPGQNLQVIPGSVNFTYYEDLGYNYSCNSSMSNQQPVSFGVSDNLGTLSTPTNLQNPEFQITNMPGTCVFGRSNYTVITFDATVMPQLYGNKINQAVLTTGQNASVGYTIDQSGVLEIDKIADAQIVENGQSFNYILTVTNSGTVPLDNIVITDNLPSCVNVSGPVVVKDALGSTVSNSTSGALTITVSPTAQLLPGDDMIITIPVTKSVSGSCCNITASVVAEMVTTGVSLNAIDDGTVAAPAACVIGTECCDIADFDASITNNNGTYSVQINGGVTPLQEVEIAMVDYHITYSEAACAPSDLGNFGTITTSNTNLSGLLLNATDNGTSSLTWLAGNPAVINSAVNLDIINPEVLNLDCCDTTLYFCLKIRVKDVNCNVCEITVCYSSDDESIVEPEPCDIEVQSLSKDNFCIGDTIPLNWTSSNSSGLVDILLVGSGSTTIQIASGIADSGNYNYTIPQGFSCDDGTQWSFVIRDSDQDLFGDCTATTSRFTVSCCEEECGCGKWLNDRVEIQAKYKKNKPNDDDLPMLTSVPCKGKIKLSASKMNYNFIAPAYQCEPENCEVTYEWTVVDIGTGQQVDSHLGNSYSPTVVKPGVKYGYKITPICGGEKCPPCQFTVGYTK